MVPTYRSVVGKVTVKEGKVRIRHVLHMAVGVCVEQIAVGEAAGLGLVALAVGVHQALLLACCGVYILCLADDVLVVSVGGIVTS